MVETLEALMNFHGKKAKCIVWEHNTHVGDARYTDMKDDGLVNVGQLVRERYGAGENVFIVGFSSYTGSVIAGKIWGGKMQNMDVPKAVPNSLEHILHADSADDKLILLRDDSWRERLKSYLPHRAIGVVYHAEYERGNYVPSLIPSRYDAMLYIDRSTALHPLHIKADISEIPETYPFGF